ncbi:exported hypothetical protein [Candidatus Zixiibacteriota bacterium]|nr:exported hypothetical protein [candidate division Zixibacteria bacterium]
MKTKLTILTAIAIVMMWSVAGAFDYKLGYDFGNPFDENNNYAPINYPGVGHLPSPGLLGEGGEGFDLEGLHFAVRGDMVHIALVNSFGLSAYSTAWHQSYGLGNIFFGFGQNSTSYAIDAATGQLYAVDRFTGIPNIPGSYYGTYAIRSMVGAWRMTSGVSLGTTLHERTMWQGLETNTIRGGSGDTWVMEFAFNKNLLNWNGSRTINFHNTLACGNDVINKSFTVVPEPTTMLLLGLGMLGLGAVRRKD